MIADIFEAIVEATTGMCSAVGNVITKTTELIYNPTQGSLTTFGTLCLVVVGAGLVWFGFRLVKNLIRLRG